MRRIVVALVAVGALAFATSGTAMASDHHRPLPPHHSWLWLLLHHRVHPHLAFHFHLPAHHPGHPHVGHPVHHPVRGHH